VPGLLAVTGNGDGFAGVSERLKETSHGLFESAETAGIHTDGT
jgi:hypothetical protein